MRNITPPVETGSSLPQPASTKSRARDLVAAVMLFGMTAAVAHAQGPAPQSIVVGGGKGMPPQVRIFDAAKLDLSGAFQPFDSKGRGGEARVAMGDVNRDGVDDIIVGAGAGGGPHVRVFSGTNGAVLADFFAYPASFRGGVYVAGGDVNGDGFADVITGAGAGGGPHVKVFDLSSPNQGPLLHASILAFDPQFVGGVRVAAGDVSGDGTADIIVAAGPGGGPHVRVFSGKDFSLRQSFFAYSPSFQGGVFIAAGDLDNDGVQEIVTGADAGGGPHVKVFDGISARETSSFFAYPARFQGGVRVATAVLGRDGRAAIVTGTGTGGAGHVRIFDGTDHTLLRSFAAYGRKGSGAIYVAGRN